MKEALEKLKEKHGPGFQFYPQGGGKWHVQLETTILRGENLQRAKDDLAEKKFTLFYTSEGIESWFN
ncbi:hypothetical protein AUJ38_03305 [bacterium CG1_02_42_9]|nr:MAG: hypothetical protein AUJ38_03305 [bacterium CG1_02_42_9]